jgi:GNAT superfamily N-acetyltransferase
VNVRPIEESDRPWVAETLDDELGGRLQARRGEVHDVSLLPGFIAEEDGRPVGLVTLRFEGGEMEVAALLAVEQWRGAGTALLDAARREAERSGCRRAWLITTNDNVDAIRFYQRRGWDWVALHRDALVESRRLKPEIGELGSYGIPIRHELEFELMLEAH